MGIVSGDELEFEYLRGFPFLHRRCTNKRGKDEPEEDLRDANTQPAPDTTHGGTWPSECAYNSIANLSFAEALRRSNVCGGDSRQESQVWPWPEYVFYQQ